MNSGLAARTLSVMPEVKLLVETTLYATIPQFHEISELNQVPATIHQFQIEQSLPLL